MATALNKTRELQVDILIPSHNSEKTIGRCLESILNQDYNTKLLKVIIVDSSTDNTVNIINKYRDALQINLITIKHHGVSFARQTLVNSVKSPYFYFIDADDYLLEHAMTNIVNASKNGEHDITTAKTKRILPNGKTQRWLLTSNFHKRTSLKTYILNNHMSIWNNLYKTVFIQKFNFHWNSEQNFAEDTIFSYYYFARAKSIGMCTKYTYAYVKSDNSMSNLETVGNKYVAQLLDNIDYYLTLEENDHHKNIDQKIKRITIQSLLYNAAIYIFALYFILPIWKHMERPSKTDWLKHKNLYNYVLRKHKIKFECPKTFLRMLTYFLFLKRKFK